MSMYIFTRRVVESDYFNSGSSERTAKSLDPTYDYTALNIAEITETCTALTRRTGEENCLFLMDCEMTKG
jgi:hypothetical protein